MDNISISQALLPHYINYLEDISLFESEAAHAKKLHAFFFVDNHDLIDITFKDTDNIKKLAKSGWTVDKVKEAYSPLPAYWIYKLITEEK